MQNYDAEKFASLWWGSSSSPLPFDCESWMEKSHVDPSPFWKTLFALHQKNKRTPTQSQLHKHYDFYHDCILRHVDSNDVAYTVIDKDQTENWTYKQLHQCVNFHIKEWQEYNLKPGQLVVLNVEPELTFLIGLLTALRLGLTICFLPPSPLLGNKQITRMLSDIKPHLIVTEQDFSLKDFSYLRIDVKGVDEQNHLPLSFPYPATATNQITLSLYRQEPLAFVPLDAQTVYLHALREALVTFNLREHLSWASPLSCPIRTEPCSTIMALLAGARRVCIPDRVIMNDPQLLKDEKIHLLGISESLQQLWSRIPSVPARQLKACYKSPLDINYRAWKAFIQINKLEKIAAFQVLMDNSLGGVGLFSRPSTENLDFFLKPSMGISWSLDNVESGSPSTTGYGIFSPHLSCSENSQKESNLTLSQIDKSCTLAGSIHPSKEGITFPLDALEEVVNLLPFVEICMLLPIPQAGHIANCRFVLLIFISPTEENVSHENKEEWNRTIEQEISEHLGRGFFPDQIEYYPLLPKTTPWGIDRNWCSRQYLRGILTKKTRDPAYQILHRLKKIAAGPDKLAISIGLKSNLKSSYA